MNFSKITSDKTLSDLLRSNSRSCIFPWLVEEKWLYICIYLMPSNTDRTSCTQTGCWQLTFQVNLSEGAGFALSDCLSGFYICCPGVLKGVAMTNRHCVAIVKHIDSPKSTKLRDGLILLPSAPRCVCCHLEEVVVIKRLWCHVSWFLSSWRSFGSFLALIPS
jgi:hypothetical protein